MTAATTVTATFTLKRFLLTVGIDGNGQGSVTSSPIGINCPSNRTNTFNFGTVVAFTATPAPGSIFDNWSGTCSGLIICQVTNEASVGASFSRFRGTLVVTNDRGEAKVEVFDSTAGDNATPLRVIAGAATTLRNPRAVAVVDDEIIVADMNAGAIDVFPLLANGDVAPVRRITGFVSRLPGSSDRRRRAVRGHVRQRCAGVPDEREWRSDTTAPDPRSHFATEHLVWALRHPNN